MQIDFQRFSQMLPLRYVLLLLGSVMLFSAEASAQYYKCTSDGRAEDPLYDPCPTPSQQPEDVGKELALPLPGGGRMLFRAIPVPGTSFWYEPDRTNSLGSLGGPMFEALVVTTIAGSFEYPELDSWKLLIGKYEVSVAQYAAVMGQGNLEKGIAHLLERAPQVPRFQKYLKDAEPGSRVWTAILAEPVRGLSYYDMQQFVFTFQQWCMSDTDCREALPKVDGHPGDIRFPTEVEWEYAARGAVDPELDQSGTKFRQKLPFPDDEVDLFANISTGVDPKIAKIGSYLPDRNGVFDMFGNVKEIMENRFVAELLQGKVGEYALRGGGFHTNPQGLGSAKREEFTVYTKSGDDWQPRRGRDVGMRLAIGSAIMPTASVMASLETSYKQYTEKYRNDSGLGQSNASSLVQAAVPLDGIADFSNQLRSEYGNSIPSLPGQLDQLDGYVEEARRRLEKTSQDLALRIGREATLAAGEFGRSLNNLRRAKATKERFKKLMEIENLPQYQRKFQEADIDIEYNKKSVEAQFTKYVDLIEELSSMRQYAQGALAEINKLQGTPRDNVSRDFVALHVEEVLAGKADPTTWQQQMTEGYPPSLFQAR